MSIIYDIFLFFKCICISNSYFIICFSHRFFIKWNTLLEIYILIDPCIKCLSISQTMLYINFLSDAFKFIFSKSKCEQNRIVYKSTIQYIYQ